MAYRPAVEGTQCGKRRICVAGLCKKTTIAAMFTESTTLEPKITKTVSIKSRTIRRKETNVNQIRQFQKEISPKKIVQIKEALPSFLPLTSSCIDEMGINVRGVRSCDNLFKSFAFAFCGNQRVKRMCCGSHALYC